MSNVKYKIEESYLSYCATCDYSSHTQNYDNYYGNITYIDKGWIEEVRYWDIYLGCNNSDKIESVRDYCLERFIRKTFNKDSFNFRAKSGYYGDEPAVEVVNDVFIKLKEFINTLNDDSVSDSFIVEDILKLEYKFILDELKNKSWKFNIINTEDIIAGSIMRHTSDEVLEKYLNETKINICDPLEEYSVNLGCICQKIGNKFRLIDGYHRYATAVKLKFPKIIAIYCE